MLLPYGFSMHVRFTALRRAAGRLGQFADRVNCAVHYGWIDHRLEACPRCSAPNCMATYVKRWFRIGRAAWDCPFCGISWLARSAYPIRASTTPEAGYVLEYRVAGHLSRLRCWDAERLAYLLEHVIQPGTTYAVSRFLLIEDGRGVWHRVFVAGPGPGHLEALNSRERPGA